MALRALRASLESQGAFDATLRVYTQDGRNFSFAPPRSGLYGWADGHVASTDDDRMILTTSEDMLSRATVLLDMVEAYGWQEIEG